MTNQRMHEILVPAIAEKLFRCLHPLGSECWIARCHCQGKRRHYSGSSRAEQEQSASSRRLVMRLERRHTAETAEQMRMDGCCQKRSRLLCSLAMPLSDFGAR